MNLAWPQEGGTGKGQVVTALSMPPLLPRMAFENSHLCKIITDSQHQRFVDLEDIIWSGQKLICSCRVR